ncbi:MAG: CopG family transcriptional regulator [Methanomassiliicoccales archaeon Mx-03]|nr:CopG family transcriptional regulator [Methanomassiliicoccaceae archaeon DOK]TQS80437.1 MAG: CopG family transcriptional regulator [Methanomassiliicoccales archaeon Mx-03]
MGIVSISLNEDNLAALDRIQKTYGLSGRSEAVRTSINAALADIRELEGMDGTVEGVLIIVRGNHADPWMSMIQARYESHIKTQMHSHLQNHKCLEVMVVSCDADVLSSMMKEIQAEGKADYVKFVRG